MDSTEEDEGSKKTNNTTEYIKLEPKQNQGNNEDSNRNNTTQDYGKLDPKCKAAPATSENLRRTFDDKNELEKVSKTNSKGRQTQMAAPKTLGKKKCADEKYKTKKDTAVPLDLSSSQKLKSGTPKRKSAPNDSLGRPKRKSGVPKRKSAPKSFKWIIEEGEIHTDAEKSDFEEEKKSELEVNMKCRKRKNNNKAVAKQSEDLSEVKPKKKRISTKRYIYPNVVCTVCGREVAYGYVKSHMAIHQGKLDYACKICGKAYAVRGSLTSHVKIRHSERKSYLCSICGKSFATNRFMRFHEYNSHKDKFPDVDVKTIPNMVKKKPETKQHHCDVCEKQYYYPWELKSHMGIHTGDSKHACTICNKIFSKGSNLNRHLKTTHDTERRQFKCSYCPQAFTQNSSRKVHERRHTGDKPFSCSICFKKFNQKSNKTIHEKKCTSSSKNQVLRTSIEQPVDVPSEQVPTEGKYINITFHCSNQGS